MLSESTQSMTIATITIHIEKTGEKKTLTFKGTVESLLKQLNINPVTVIVAADKKLVPMEHELDGTKHIDILSVVSGG